MADLAERVADRARAEHGDKGGGTAAAATLRLAKPAVSATDD